MKYLNIGFHSLPRIDFAHRCTIRELNGQPRVNEYYELTFVERGELKVCSKALNMNVTVGAGEFFFAPARVEYEAYTEDDLTHSCAAFFLEGDVKVCEEEEIVFDKPDNTVFVKIENLFVPLIGRFDSGKTEEIVGKIISECLYSSKEYSNLRCAQLIIELLLSVSYDKPLPSDVEPSSRYYAEKLSDYLLSGFSDPGLNMQSVSERMGLHPNYVGAIYKGVTGKTVMTALKEIRIAEAKRLLRLKKYLIKDIAKMVGFDDCNYFSVVFKKAVGVSPNVFARGESEVTLRIRQTDADRKA